MTAFDLRPFAHDDEAALLQLWEAAFVYEPASVGLLREKIWQDPGFDTDLTVAALTEEGTFAGMGMAVMRTVDGAQRGYVKLLAVAPESRREGLGRLMLRRLEDELKKHRVEEIRVAESAPNYLTPGLDVRYTPAMLLLDAEGYACTGETYNLHVDLRQDWDTSRNEMRLAQQGVIIRRAELEDQSEMASFLAEHWPAWQAEIAVAFEQDPIALHLAVRDTEVLGFSAYDTNNIGTGWFGPMGTAPGVRGLGIGGLLLKRCLADLKAQGLAHAVIPWVGPVRFYSNSVGATIDRVFYRYAKQVNG
ncbi:MAG: hypothetical protein RhofKO_15960 [Rhodothermales bacterium]